MLRESMQTQGKSVALRDVTQGLEHGLDVPHAAELMAFAEAVVQRDDTRIASARRALLPLLGAAGLVDAAATVAAFHGFVRVADAIGIPHYSPPAGGDLSQLREEAGINDFFRAGRPAGTV
jgi:hypothetical protein